MKLFHTFPAFISPPRGAFLLLGIMLGILSPSIAQTPGGVADSLVFWLQATDINNDGGATNPSSGDSVNTWRDVSGTASTHHFSDTVDNGTYGDLVPPLYGEGNVSEAINFQPVIRFENDQAGLSTADANNINLLSTDLRSIAVVIRTSPSASSSREVVYEQGGGSNGLNIYTDNGSVYAGAWALGAPSTWNVWQSGAVGNSSVQLVSLVFDGARDSMLSAYLNGTLLGSDTVNQIPSHNGNIAIGQTRNSTRGSGWSSNSANANYFGGQLGEIVYYGQAWNSSERTQVESYLAIKYGVSLSTDYVDASGSSVWTIAGNSGFTSGVSAIFRDDSSGLDQRQSRSSSTGSILTIGLDTVMASNDSHPTAFGSDGDGLFFSHNGSSANGDTGGLPSGYTLILERVWQVREPNGEVGDVDLSFDLSAFNLPGSSASDYSILVKNSSSDFTSGATAYSGTQYIADSILVFDGIDLDDGDRFTLATIAEPIGPGNVDSNLQLWFAADRSITTPSGGVSNWSNLAPLAYPLLQTDAGERPNWSASSNLVNFLPSVAFNGTTDYLALDGLYYTTSNRIDRMMTCAVFRTTYSDGNSNGNWAFLDFDRSEYFNLAISGANGAVRVALADGTIDDIESSTTGYNDGLAHIACATYDNTLTNDATIRVDGNIEYNNDVKGTGVALGAGSTLTRYGFVGDGSEADTLDGTRNDTYYEGDIAEIIMYEDISLTSTQQAQIETYLAIRYGIHLADDYVASDGTIVWDAGTLSAYHNGVVAIARDDDGQLLQKQSKSETVGAVLTMALGTLAATNADNGGSFASDGLYALVGHDAGTTDATDTGVTTGYVNRLNRTWRYRENGGDPGNLTLRFDLTTAVISGVVAADFGLAVRNGDDDLSTTDTVFVATAYDGSNLDFTGINLDNDDYFTIVSSNEYDGPAPGGIASSLELWFAADSAMSTSGSDITAWGNSAPKSSELTQTASGNRPNLVSAAADWNFNPTVRFNGTSDYLPLSQLSMSTALNQVAACAVFRTSFGGGAYDDNWGLLDFDRSDWFNLYVRGDDGAVGFSYSASTIRDVSSSTTGFNDSLPHLACVRYDNTMTNDSYMRVDGNVESSSNLEILGSKVGTANTRFGFVGDGSEASSYNGSRNSYYYEGDMPELVLFLEDTLTDASLDKIETYLGIKYGIHLAHDYVASNDVVIWDSSALATYHNDVAGIGKDLASGLDQRKSRSTNGDDLLTMWLGAVANESNPLAFPGDLDFVLWGNDDGRTDTVITTDMPAGIVERIPREWRLAEKDNISLTDGGGMARDVGQVSVQFDLTVLAGEAYVSPTISEDSLLNLRMLVSASSDFTGASSYSPSAVSVPNRTATFTVPGADISDGSFITLGSIGPTPLPVTWLSFDATPADHVVWLDWATATEWHADRFEIQRAVDGQNWQKLGSVTAAGGQGGATYRFADEAPLPGIAFYRLRQIDNDGSENFSVIRSVNFGESDHWGSITPNPTSGSFTLQYEAALAGQLEWSVQDARGHMHAHGVHSVLSGNNNLQWELPNLANGAYRLVLHGEDGRLLYQSSLLVQH